MAFSRTFDDTDQVVYKNIQSTFEGRYMLNVPGNGNKPPFIEDPQIILQKWGANLMTHPVQLESFLLGYEDKLNRDCSIQPKLPNSHLPNYPVNQNVYTDQPRSLQPAWELRDNTIKQQNVLLFNPQAYTEVPFRTNISTRLYERHQKQRNNC